MLAVLDRMPSFAFALNIRHSTLHSMVATPHDNDRWTQRHCTVLTHDNDYCTQRHCTVVTHTNVV